MQSSIGLIYGHEMFDYPELNTNYNILCDLRGLIVSKREPIIRMNSRTLEWESVSCDFRFEDKLYATSN